jgi:hypothetical protein
MYLDTISFSKILESMQVTDIGRNSDKFAGLLLFGVGQILADFQTVGYVPKFMILLNISENNGAIKMALFLRYHDGILSGPEPVVFK